MIISATVHHADVVEPLRVVVLINRELLVVKVLETVSLYLSHIILAQYPVTVGHCGWRGSGGGLLCKSTSTTGFYVPSTLQISANTTSCTLNP